MFRILAVEDNPADLKLLDDLLRMLGRPYKLDWAKNGIEAMEVLARQLAHHSLPDLVLMDVRMPQMDGLQTLRAIKTNPRLRVLPVIMLSTSVLATDVRSSYEAYANAFVQKPLTLSQSERLIRAIAAFWIDFAIPSTVPNDVNAGDNGKRDANVSVEAESQAMFEVEAVVGLGEISCDERRRLIQRFASTVKELLVLHQEQFDAAIHGDQEYNRFDLLIHMANESKQRAKYELLRHVESHGCSNHDVISNPSRT